MNVLGIIFNASLQWGPQVTTTLKKANKALNAIRLIKNYFTSEQLITLITSNFYSILFYNSEVWHLPTFKTIDEEPKALKLCAKSTNTWMLSYKNLHEMAGRAPPDKIMNCKLALHLYKVVNNEVPLPDWLKQLFA